MSTIAIIFQTQPLDFSPVTPGELTINYNDGNTSLPLSLRLTLSAVVAGTFGYVAHVGDGVESAEDQAQAFASSFNNNYSRVGLPAGVFAKGNLAAQAVDNVVTITADVGTFENGSSYNGNVIVPSFGTPNNSTQISDVSLTVTRVLSGSCSSINYTATASGGEGPYTITQNNNVITTNWDGTLLNFALTRGGNNFREIKVTDSAGRIATKQEFVPRAMTEGEFSVSQTKLLNGNDLVVNKNVNVAGNNVFEYALENQGATEGTSFQSENTFTLVPEGIYELFIRDVYGCVIKKTVQVIELTVVTDVEQTVPYFKVMEGNSIIFAECVEYGPYVKKNITNTLSENEHAGINYAIEQHFDPSDFIATQFKSSYPFHNIWIHTDDGARTSVQPILLQENIGVRERVDIKQFPFGDRTAFYFDGGNQYEPGTATVIGPSPYTDFSPDWAEVGQIVNIGGSGVFEIVEEQYDEDLQKSIYIVEFTSTESADVVIEVVTNTQLYNLFEFYVSISHGQKARIYIEKGFNDNGTFMKDGNPWVSEIIVGKNDEEDDLLLQWSDDLNKGNIVFQTGIEFIKRKKGSIGQRPRGEADTSDGDSKTFNIFQSAYQGYLLRFEDVSSKEAIQLSIATGLDNFRVNNLVMVRNAFPSIEPIENTNLFSFEVELSYGGDLLATRQNELVINTTNGIVGGDSDGKVSVELPSYDGRTRLAANGQLIIFGENYVSI